MSQHKKLDIIEFCEQYTNLKLTKFQEEMLRFPGKYSGLKLRPAGSWNWYRRLGADEFTCGRLLKMKQGEEFVLVGPDGARRFVLAEIRPPQSRQTSIGFVDEIADAKEPGHDLEVINAGFTSGALGPDKE